MDHKRTAMAVDRAVSVLGLAKMVAASGLKRRTVQNDMEGITSPTIARVRAYVRALDEAGRREASAELLDALLSPIGREARPLPTVCPSTSPELAALHLAGDAGAAVRWAEDALRDGVIDYAEAAQGERVVREARHAVDEFEAIVRGAAARTPQRNLLAGGSR